MKKSDKNPKLSKVVMKKIDKNIYQYGKYSFQVKMMVASHQVSKVFDTLNEARTWRYLQRAASSLDVDEKRIFEARVNKRAALTFTVKQALDRYAADVTPAKKGASVELTRIGKAKRTALCNKSFYMVTPDDVLAFMEEIGGSDNNKRKYASLISHLYRMAKERWRMTTVENPVIGKIEMPSNGKPRKRRLKGDEEMQLLKHLSGEAKIIFVLAIETSMRKGEILSLEWQYIDLKEPTATLPDTKNDDERIVPLSSNAIKLLKSLTRGNGSEKVFKITNTQLRRAWEAARTAAKISDLRFHDLRHEGTSRLFEKGLNVMEAAAVTGHKTLSVLQDYTHPNPKDIAKKLA
jgi:integrase